MATRELRIRVTAEEAGAATTINRISAAMERMPKEAVYSIDFHEAQVGARVQEITAQMQREADRHQISIEAKLIEKEARTRLFGLEKPARGPLPLTAFVPSLADIEAAAEAQGPAIVRSMFGPQAVRAARGRGEEVGGGFLESLKRTLGGRSGAKDVIELLRGAGPVAAVALAARTLGDMGASAKSLADQFYSGSINSREMSLELAKSIPIIGQIVRFGEGLDAWLGNSVKKAAELKAEMAAIAAAQERGNRVASIVGPINDAAGFIGATPDQVSLTRAEQDADQRRRNIARGWEDVAAIQRDMLKFGNQYYPNSKDSDVRETWEKLKIQRDRLREDLFTAEENSQRLLADAQAQLDKKNQADRLADWENFMRHRRAGELAHIDELTRKQKDADDATERRLRQRHDDEQQRIVRSQDDVDAIRDRIQTPAERFQKEAQHYADLYRQGLITQDEAIRATRKAGEGLDAGGRNIQPSAGTASAQIAGLLTGVVEQSRGRQVDAVKRTNKLLEDAIELLRKIAGGGSGGGEPIL
jgi:hypothetical protein